MSYLVLRADRLATVLADDPVVRAPDVGGFRDAMRLLAEAERLRAEASAATEEAGEAARAEGYAAGLAEGRAAAERDRQAELFRLALRNSELHRERQRDIARIALEVVRRIAGELGDPAMMAGIVERALSELAPESHGIVRVAPEVIAAVRARLAGRDGFEVQADPALAATDCVIETALGRIHAGLETQLGRIETLWNEAQHG